MPNRRRPARSEVERARRLRQEPSVAERIFWKLARGSRLGFEIRRQHPVIGYVVDFYSPEAKLAIEFDGEQHDPVRDARRDEALRGIGIETIRIPNRDFFMIDLSDQQRTDWIEAIVRRFEERTGRRVPR